jgi:excisionase family DNA binding protein
MPIDLDPTTKPTLSVDEAAALFHISRSVAFQAVKTGEIPSLRFGRRIRIPTAAVRAMLHLDDELETRAAG